MIQKRQFRSRFEERYIFVISSSSRRDRGRRLIFRFLVEGGSGSGARVEIKGDPPPPLLRSGSPRRKRFVKGNYSVLGANNGGIGYTLFARRVRDKNPGPSLLFAAGRAPSPLPLLPSHSLSYVPVVTDPETWPVIGPSLAQ